MFPPETVLIADFNEYKDKEQRKWKARSERMGFRFPMFSDFEEFKSALRNAKVIELTPQHDAKVANRSHTSSLDQLKRLVSMYQQPRDVDRIVQGYSTNAAMPYPIIVRGRYGEWIMAGNTRLDTAFILGIKPKVLLVDISD